MCVGGRSYMRVTAQVWRSEDNVWKLSPSTERFQGPCLGLEAWCLLPLGHLTRVYSSSPGAERKVTPKANTEEWICTYSPRGLRVYRGREAREQAAGTAARAQAESHILSDKHEHREQLKRGEASHSRSLPPWHSSSGNWRPNAQLRETVEDSLKSPHAAPKFCLTLQTASLFG